MQTFRELLQKKAKQQTLREERDKEFKITEDAENILAEALAIEVDTSQPILYQMVEAVQNYSEDLDGQDKLLQKVEKKFKNKVLELIAQQISIYQVELSTFLGSLEASCTNVSLLFGKLCDISNFNKEIKEKMSKVDEDHWH